MTSESTEKPGSSFMKYLQPLDCPIDSLGYRVTFEKTHCSPPKVEPPATFPNPFAIWCTEAANIRGGITINTRSPAKLQHSRIEYVRIVLFDANSIPILDGLKDSEKPGRTFWECERENERFLSSKFGVDKTSSEYYNCIIGEFPKREGGFFRLGMVVKIDDAVYLHFLPEFWSVSKLPQQREINPMWKDIAMQNGFQADPGIHIRCISRGFARTRPRKRHSAPEAAHSKSLKGAHNQRIPQLPHIHAEHHSERSAKASADSVSHDSPSLPPLDMSLPLHALHLTVHPIHDDDEDDDQSRAALNLDAISASVSGNSPPSTNKLTSLSGPHVSPVPQTVPQDDKEAASQFRFTYEVDFTDYCQNRSYKFNPEMMREMPSRWKTLIQGTPTLRPHKVKKMTVLDGSPSLASSIPEIIKSDFVRHTIPPSQYTKHLYSKHLDAFWDKIYEDSKMFVEYPLPSSVISTSKSASSSHLLVQ